MLSSPNKFIRMQAVAAAALALTVSGLGVARAQSLIYGIGGTDNGTGPAVPYSLFSFNSNTPGTTTTYGTVATTSGFVLTSIAFQPSTGQLFGLQYNGTTNQAQLLTINRTNAATATVGTPFTIGSISGSSGSNSAAISFNPVNGAIRLDTGTFGNYRISASTGALLGQDTNIAYAPGDPNAPNTFQISGIGYTPGTTSTTLYGYDYINNNLVTQNITAGATPLGQLTTIGFSNLAATQGGASTGFTIGLGTSGFLNTSVSTDASPFVRDHLYSVSLANGSVTDNGFIGTAVNFNTVNIAAFVPEPGTYVFFAAGGLLIGGLVSRRRSA